MDPIYVTGHRNPDTDSIVSARPMLRCETPWETGSTRLPVWDTSVTRPQLVLDSFGISAAGSDQLYVYPGPGPGI